MKNLIRLSSYFVLGLLAFSLAPAATPGTSPEKALVIDAVTAADDERMAAMKTGDAARLNAIFSDELRYAHSSGTVDTKAVFIEALSSGKSVYETFEYKDRTILPAAPGIALMSGRVLVNIRSAGQRLQLDLNYLSVWREEAGKWRFLAWQSCRNGSATPLPAAAK